MDVKLISTIAVQFANLGSGLIQLPIAIAYLTDKELKYWFAFLALGGIGQVLEFGMLSTFIRYFSYNSQQDDNISEKITSKILGTAKYSYLIVALIAFFVVIGAGHLYLNVYLDAKSYIYFTWLIYGLGICVNLYSNRYISLISGINKNEISNFITIAAKLALILFCYVLVPKYELLGFALSSILSAVVMITLAYFVHGIYTNWKKIKIQKDKEIFSNVKKMGLTQIAAFILQKGVVLIVIAHYQDDLAVSFSLTLNVLMLVSTVAAAYQMAKIPLINKLMNLRKYQQIKLEVQKSYLFSIIFYIISCWLMINFGDLIFGLMGKENKLLNGATMYLISGIVFLEMIHSIAAGFIAASNQFPFYKAGVVTATIVLMGGWYISQRHEMWVFIAFIGIAQLSYNNWKWPFYLWKKYDWKN